MNYYGPQRFGSGSCVQADQIGLALLKEEMVPLHVIYFHLMSICGAPSLLKKPYNSLCFEQEASVKLFFTPEDGDDLQNKAKRHFLLTGL